jgi:hypothetical protein
LAKKMFPLIRKAEMQRKRGGSSEWLIHFPSF